MKASNEGVNVGIDADRLRQMSRRKEQNRNAQRRLRERKEEYTSQLEAQLTDLHRHSQTQEDETRFLREALDRLRSENQVLTQQIARIHQSVPSTQESHPLPQRASIDLGTNHFAHPTQFNTRSRSQSDASSPHQAFALSSIPTHQSKQRVSSATYKHSESSSDSPTNRPFASVNNQKARSSSPKPFHPNGSDLSSFDSDSHMRSGSEQTESTPANTAHYTIAEPSDLASAASTAAGSSMSSYPAQTTTDEVMASCLESIYSQTEASRLASTRSNQSDRISFDFAAPWTPSSSEYATSNLMLSDLNSLNSSSTAKPYGITPGAAGATIARVPASSNDGWTMSPWLNFGNTPSGDLSKIHTSTPHGKPAAIDADQNIPDDRQTSLASRRGFSRTLNFEQGSF